MIILGPIIGHVDANGVNILFEVDRNGIVALTLHGQDQEIKKDIEAKRDRPNIIHIELPKPIDQELWILRLQQLSDASIKYGSFSRGSTIAFVSCNNYEVGGGAVWQRLRTNIPHVIVHMGDNICLDNGNSYMNLALLGARCRGYTGALDAIREAYRIHWSKADVAYVLANCSNIMIWDDHDVCDSWDQDLKLPDGWCGWLNMGGWSLVADKASTGLEGDRRWSTIAMIAAIQAYCEYQLPLSHGPGTCIPGSWSMKVGTREQDMILIDRRMHRTGNTPLIPHLNSRPKIIIATVPLFFLGPMITNKVIESILHHIGGIRDLWDHWLLDPQDLDEVLDLIDEDTIIMSGDAHICLETEIRLNSNVSGRSPMKITQITSSAISSPPVPRLVDILLGLGSFKFKTPRHSGHVKHRFRSRDNGYYAHGSKKQGFIFGHDQNESAKT